MPATFQQPMRPAPRATASGRTDPNKGMLDYLMEKDDVLLYVTAALGVLLPGIVYVVYHRVHAAYQRYSQRKEAERLAEEKAKAELAIFYTRNADLRDAEKREIGDAEKWAAVLAEYMGEEKPTLFALDNMAPSDFGNFKGFGIFLMECDEHGRADAVLEGFLDYLESAAADKHERRRLAGVPEMRYAILGFQQKPMAANAEIVHNRAVDTLSKRLRILGATPVVPDRNFELETAGYDREETFKLWATDLFQAIDHWGEADSEEEYDTDLADGDGSEAEEDEEGEDEDGDSERLLKETASEGLRMRRRRHV